MTLTFFKEFRTFFFTECPWVWACLIASSWFDSDSASQAGPLHWFHRLLLRKSLRGALDFFPFFPPLVTLPLIPCLRWCPPGSSIIKECFKFVISKQFVGRHPEMHWIFSSPTFFPSIGWTSLIFPAWANYYAWACRAEVIVSIISSICFTKHYSVK